MLQLDNTRKAASDLLHHILANQSRHFVFDLDGVLFNAEHRQVFKNGVLDLPHYLSNNTPDNIGLDKNLPIIEAVRQLNQIGITYSVCTARTMCLHNRRLLLDRMVLPIEVMCRDGEHDKRRDSTLKRAKLLEYSERSRIPIGNMTLIDDAPSNIEMACSIGMRAIKVNWMPKAQAEQRTLNIRPLLC